jgi:hypothetical protein
MIYPSQQKHVANTTGVAHREFIATVHTLSLLPGGSMKSWGEAWRDGLWSGSAASITSTAALAVRGKREVDSSFATTNVISRWIWGDAAALHDEPDLKHTVVGYAIHHASSTMWAVIYEKVFGHHADNKHILPATLGAATVGTLAYLVDYKVTPYRLEPGFDKHLSSPSMFLVYAVFGAGLLVRGLTAPQKKSRMEKATRHKPHERRAI